MSRTEDKYEWFEHKVKTMVPTGFNLNHGALKREDEKIFYAFLTKEYNKARSAWPDMIPEDKTKERSSSRKEFYSFTIPAIYIYEYIWMVLC